MLRRVIVLLALIVIIFGCARKNTGYKDEHILELERSIPMVGNPLDMDFAGGQLYVAEDQGGISIIDLANYTKKWFTRFNGAYGDTVSLVKIRKIAFVESRNKLFINETDGTDLIQIIDTTNPDTMLVINAITGATQDIQDMRFMAIPNPTNQFTIEGYFSAGRTVKHGRFDGTTNLWFGSGLDLFTPQRATGFDFNETYIYVTIEQRGLIIYNRATRAVVGEVDLPGEAQKVKLAGNYAYVACQQEGLQIVDVSNPAVPVRISGIDTSGYATSIDVWNNYAVVSSGGGGIYLYDISNPHNPRQIDNITSCGYTNLAKFYQGKVMVAARDQGILVYRIIP